jgi:sugar phosphate isomerase/epimerase
MPKPKFSVSQITTFHQTFEEDVDVYAKAGVDGVGIWEFKLPEDRDDAGVLAALKASGLKATTCIPSTLSVFPVPFPGPDDHEERIVELCAAIDRFAPFEPAVVLCLTGNPPEGMGTAEAQSVIVDGLRTAARRAAEHGLDLGLEPLHREYYGNWSTVYTIPEALSVIDEIGEPNMRLMYDVYHLSDTKDVLAETERNAGRLARSVHICDKREPTRNDFDRALPGEGSIDLAAIFGAIEAGGGAPEWVDLEIFSDDGSFTDMDFEDSLWKQDPFDVIRRAKAGFDTAWEARRPLG